MTYTSPQTWHQWDAQAWNKQLLRFCFVDNADASPDEGLRASEEDLPEVTKDHTSEPQTMAEKLVQELKWQAQRQNRTPANFVLGYQMRHYTPSALEEPPFFAFLWLTCLIAHGYPDPDQKGGFHGRYEQVFGHLDHQRLKLLTKAWEKLSEWLAIEGLFGGVRYRRLKLPPREDYRCNISHSWWLAFPRLSDYRLLKKLLSQLHGSHGQHLKANSLQLISRLLAETEFSSDFRDELKRWQQALNKKPDDETWFGSFLGQAIQKTISIETNNNRQITGSSPVFGSLILCYDGDVLGVLLLADGIPEPDGWHGEPGCDWCEKLNEHPLLVPNDSEDPEYAAFEGGSCAIDIDEESPIAELRPLIDRGLLPFGLDPDLRFPRLLLTPSAEQEPSHVVLFQENCKAFQEQFNGRKIDNFDLEEEGWVCIRYFEATARQLKTFATSGVSPDGKEPSPKLTPRKGLFVQSGYSQSGYLARGLGLPNVRVQFRQPAQAVELFVPKEKDPIAYIPGPDNPEIWSPPPDSRKKTAFQPGEARLVASFADVPDQEQSLQLEQISSHTQLKRSQHIVFREDWGCKLGPIYLETPKQTPVLDKVRRSTGWSP